MDGLGLECATWAIRCRHHGGATLAEGSSVGFERPRHFLNGNGDEPSRRNLAGPIKTR